MRRCGSGSSTAAQHESRPPTVAEAEAEDSLSTFSMSSSALRAARCCRCEQCGHMGASIVVGHCASLLLMLCFCMLRLQEMAVHVLQAEGDGGEVTCWRRVMRVPGHMQVWKV